MEKLKKILNFLGRRQILMAAEIFLPFLLWVFLFWDFFSGHISVNVDTLIGYVAGKYYINNLLNGVFPLWEPYVFLGRPFIGAVAGGYLNPLFYVNLILVKLGINYYHAFLAYLGIHTFLGVFGVYLLLGRILKTRAGVFAGTALLLFSGVTMGIFNQTMNLLLFVPCVWFFYFLLSFGKDFKRGQFLGLTFAAMIILTTYIPFYFGTVFACLFLIASLLYFQGIRGEVTRVFDFLKDNKGLFLFCFLAVAISAGPLILYKIADGQGDVVSLERHCSAKDFKDCILDSLGGDARMTYSETAKTGSLGERISFKELFSHLDKRSYHTDDFVYLPLFCWILIGVSFWTPLSRGKVIVLFTTTIIFLISIGEASPVHRFLYEHVFYFAYFRNLFFFSGYLMLLGVVFSVMQLESMLEIKTSSGQQNNMLCVLIVLFHFAALEFLYSQDSVVIASYLTVFGSMIFFLALLRGFFDKHKVWLKPVLLCLIVLEPIQVVHAYSRNAEKVKCELVDAPLVAEFSYSRPQELKKTDCPGLKFRDHIHYWYLMHMQDAPGIIFPTTTVARGTLAASRAVDSIVFNDYARYKFYVYDNVDSFTEEEGLPRLEGIWEGEENLALAADRVGAPSPVRLPQESSDKNTNALAIKGPSGEFRVLRFGVNSIKLETNFPADKFLVYTDSFTSQWEVFINGQKDFVYKANGAFKGFWLPAGGNVVDLRFHPRGGSGIYIAIILFFQGFLIYTLAVLYQEKKLRA